jgi:hypothetical protein
MGMLIDLILKDNLSSSDDKYFLWMDNCGPHKTPCLSELYAQAKTTVGLLPPNMTSKLQVLDLVVNGPIKAHIRNLRAKRIGEYMDEHRAQCAEAKEKSTTFPKWDMPKPSLEQCIQDLIGLFSGQFSSEKFREGVRKSFLATGTMYSNVNGEKTFTTYCDKSGCGTLPVDLNKLKELGFTVDESKLTLTENELLDAVIEMENNDFDEEVDGDDFEDDQD